MRNPNGFGGVDNLGKHRRNPYRARKTVGWEMKDGKAVQKYYTIGYYPTRKEALQALAEYNANPYDLTGKIPSFTDVFYEWVERKGSDFDERRMSQFKNAFRYYTSVLDKPFKDLKVRDYEMAINQEVPRTVRTVAKTVLSMMYKYAIVNEYCDKDLSSLVDFHIDTKVRLEREIFKEEEIQYIKEHIGEAVCDVMYIGLFTGMRPNEVLAMKREAIDRKKWIYIGGSKTDAGRNRTIPLHEEIRPIIDRYFGINTKSKLLIVYDGAEYTLQTYRRHMKSLFPNHLPHDTRHTFATQWKILNLDQLSGKKILGHTIEDLTEAVYTHLTEEYLSNEVSKFHY